MENSKEKNLARFLLTFFLGWIGSIIINNSSFKPYGYKSRTLAYFFLSTITFGIYGLVASISNLSFNPAKETNIGYIKEEDFEYYNSNNERENSSATSTNPNKTQIYLRERLEKTVSLCAAIFTLIMLFIPFAGTSCNIFSLITFQITNSMYRSIPSVIYIFGFSYLITSIVLIVLAWRNFNNSSSKDKAIIYGSIACGIIHTLIDIIYSDANEYSPIFYYPKGLIIITVFCLIYFIIGKFKFTQPPKASTTVFLTKTENTSLLDNATVELLKNLASLKDSDIITQEEFNMKKKELLGL